MVTTKTKTTNGEKGKTFWFNFSWNTRCYGLKSVLKNPELRYQFLINIQKALDRMNWNKFSDSRLVW